MFTTSILIAGVLAAASGTPDANARIAVTFELGAADGAVMVALYDSEAAYDGDGAPVRAIRIEPHGLRAVARFDGLPAGDYALRAFHDLNGDGEMNTNPFGVPVEPYVFSNEARGDRGPAPWSAARFAATGDTAQTLTLR